MTIYYRDGHKDTQKQSHFTLNEHLHDISIFSDVS